MIFLWSFVDFWSENWKNTCQKAGFSLTSEKDRNEMIFDVVDIVQSMKPNLIVVGAHMELADPTIEDGINECIVKGATSITVQPFMLSPGRHSVSDIPNMVKAIAKKHPTVSISVSPHFGPHKKIAELILERSNLL